MNWAELILHGGKVPPNLLRRMKGIARAIVDIMVLEFGPDVIVRRLADPLWFQAFNNVIGMDWDSSGSTTVVLGILKWITSTHDYGFYVVGGKGKQMLKVPEELKEVSKKIDISSEDLVKVSKASARVDSSLLQDGYELYIHSMILSQNVWTVIQQGMNDKTSLARRYHINDRNYPWRNPHEGVIGNKGEALDLSSPLSYNNVKIAVDVANERPSKILKLLSTVLKAARGQRTLTGKPLLTRAPKFYLAVRPSPQLERALTNLYEFKPRRPEDFLVAPGAGPKVMRALALISHLIYSAEPSFEDPAVLDPFAYAYAVGGKDGIPYPYDTETADHVINSLKRIIEEAKLGQKERLIALKGLARLVEKLSAPSSTSQGVRTRRDCHTCYNSSMK